MSLDDQPNPLAESGVTMRSDSEQYSPGDELSTSPASSNSPVILYKPPTVWSLLRGTAINILLPFINGMMLGFGELFAHEAAFRLGWGGTKVQSIAGVVARMPSKEHCIPRPLMIHDANYLNLRFSPSPAEGHTPSDPA